MTVSACKRAYWNPVGLAGTSHINRLQCATVYEESEHVLDGQVAPCRRVLCLPCEIAAQAKGRGGTSPKGEGDV
jgi:hypothetical protein